MSNRAPADARIGHVHLKVSDLERSEAFYRDIIGLDVMVRRGDKAAFLSAGGYHHHLGLNTWQSAGGTPPPAGHTGLFHTAFLFPDRKSLAAVVQRVIDAGVPLDGLSDHGVSEAVYLRDPDENGVELYWDRPENEWPRDPDGTIALVTERLDLDDLLAVHE